MTNPRIKIWEQQLEAIKRKIAAEQSKCAHKHVVWDRDGDREYLRCKYCGKFSARTVV